MTVPMTSALAVVAVLGLPMAAVIGRAMAGRRFERQLRSFPGLGDDSRPLGTPPIALEQDRGIFSPPPSRTPRRAA